MGDKIDYSIVESVRAKRLRIAVYPGERVVVTKPQGLSQKLVEEFVAAKSSWIEKKLTEAHAPLARDLADNTYKHFLFNRGKATSESGVYNE